jgi:hypothetical protein
MKKSTLLVAGFLVVSLAQAQINKGAILIGGNIGFSSSTTEDFPATSETKNSGFNINPSIGYAIKTNTIVGVVLSYGQSKSENDEVAGPDNSSEMNSFGGGIFVRKYVPLGKGFNFFGQGTASYNRSTTDNFFDNNKVSTQEQSAIGLGFYPGISYGISKKVQLELGLNNILNLSYNTTKNTNVGGPSETGSESKGLNFSTGFSTTMPLSLGIQILLNK